MSQTSYQVNQDVAFAGLVAESQSPVDILSRQNPAVAVPYGVGVVQGTLDADVIVPTATAMITDGRFIGVAVSEQTVVSSASGTAANYPLNSSVPVLRKGRVWVTVEEAVTPVSPVFCRFATGSGTVLGAFRASADTATAVAVPRARYMTSAGIGGLAVLELN